MIRIVSRLKYRDTYRIVISRIVPPLVSTASCVTPRGVPTDRCVWGVSGVGGEHPPLHRRLHRRHVPHPGDARLHRVDAALHGGGDLRQLRLRILHRLRHLLRTGRPPHPHPSGLHLFFFFNVHFGVVQNCQHL